MNTNIRHFNRVKLFLKLADIFRRALDGIDRNGAEHDDKNGRFTGKGNSTGGASKGKSTEESAENTNNGGKSEENSYNEHIAVTAKGSHEFSEVLFRNKQKFNNHFTKHQKEFAKIGIMTFGQYKKETRRIIESPVGGDILGHIANKKYNQIIRYDKRLNLFVKGNPAKGVFTSFIPKDGIAYYEYMKEGDLVKDGEE